MTIKLKDKTHASLRYINGQAVITFHSKNNTRIVLEKGIIPTINMLQKIYDNL
jgi:hypothetical protein